MMWVEGAFSKMASSWSCEQSVVVPNSNCTHSDAVAARIFGRSSAESWSKTNSLDLPRPEQHVGERGWQGAPSAGVDGGGRRREGSAPSYIGELNSGRRRRELTRAGRLLRRVVAQRLRVGDAQLVRYIVKNSLPR